jgi:hypothetical protein
MDPYAVLPGVVDGVPDDDVVVGLLVGLRVDRLGLGGLDPVSDGVVDCAPLHPVVAGGEELDPVVVRPADDATAHGIAHGVPICVLAVEDDPLSSGGGDLHPLDQVVVPPVEVDRVARCSRDAAGHHGQVANDYTRCALRVEGLGVVERIRVVLDGGHVHALTLDRDVGHVFQPEVLGAQIEHACLE